MPAPIGYHRAVLRPIRGIRERPRRLTAPIRTPLLQLHGERDGCIQAISEQIDQRRFIARVHEVIPNTGHFLAQEAPHALAARVARWLA
jgi:pimeloyl-ACP methyl ester carboxylesterase